MNDELEPFNDALEGELDRELAARQPNPDDLWSRVEGNPHEGDDELFDLPGVEADPVERMELAPFTAALQTEIEGYLDERALSPVPELPATRRRLAPIVGTLLAVAAVAALAWVRFAPSTATGQEQGSTLEQAANVAEQTLSERGEAWLSRPEKQAAKSPRTQSNKAERVPHPTEPPPGPQLEEEPEQPQQASPESEQQTPEAKPKKKAAPKLTLDERIAALDERAQKRWAEGDLAGANKDFETIVRIGGKRRAVQLAFGDLFSVARQRKIDPSPYWRRYLQKFPKGRYAEDAKVGLCKKAKGTAADRCWDEYRSAFPKGSHAP